MKIEKGFWNGRPGGTICWHFCRMKSSSMLDVDYYLEQLTYTFQWFYYFFRKYKEFDRPKKKKKIIKKFYFLFFYYFFKKIFIYFAFNEPLKIFIEVLKKKKKKSLNFFQIFLWDNN